MTQADTAGCCFCEDWHVHELPITNSTNLVAAKFPAWEAVRADRQTAGRGVFNAAGFRMKAGYGSPPLFQPDQMPPTGVLCHWLCASLCAMRCSQSD